MKFDIITLFPNSFSYLNESIINKAQDKGLISVSVHDLRKYSLDKKHHKVDDRPYGGGPGMVLQVEPIYRAVEGIKNKKIRSKNKNKKSRSRVILFSAKGKPFNQKTARRYSKYYDRLIMICGHYEGVDERVAEYIANEEVSVGPYILTGGELPAMIVVDGTSRHIKGVLGKEDSVEERRVSFFEEKKLETEGLNIVVSSYPVYTRPEIFLPTKGVKWKVPRVLLSGDHEKIKQWRLKN